MEAEKTHELWLDLEDGAGKLFLLITISGKTYGTDLSDETGSKISEDLMKQYSLKSSMLSGNFFDVGYLEVKIYCAKGLYAADLVFHLLNMSSFFTYFYTTEESKLFIDPNPISVALKSVGTPVMIS